MLTDDHQRDLAREHRQLKELALARDADRAIEVLTEHIDRAPSLLIAYAREHGVDDLTPPAPHSHHGARCAAGAPTGDVTVHPDAGHVPWRPCTAAYAATAACKVGPRSVPVMLVIIGLVAPAAR